MTFDHNFSNCTVVFKILSLADFQGKFVCRFYKIFPPHLILFLHYLVKL